MAADMHALMRGLRLLLVVCAMLLAGCGSRVELYAAATETEANEMLAVLLDAGVRAEKNATKDGVSISVDRAQVAQALEVLRGRGLPRESFAGMGQIFQKEGLVSSPLEEKARYIYALSQELANTFSQMDGVLVARVHVVLPERGGVGEATLPSTAAVFIKHQAGYNLDALKPQITRLVTHSIPGLTADRVSTVLVSAQPAQASAREDSGSSHVLGFEVARGSATPLAVVLAALILLVIGLAAAVGYFVWRQRAGGRRLMGRPRTQEVRAIGGPSA